MSNVIRFPGPDDEEQDAIKEALVALNDLAETGKLRAIAVATVSIDDETKTLKSASWIVDGDFTPSLAGTLAWVQHRLNNRMDHGEG